jgi:hypothetical protein
MYRVVVGGEDGLKRVEGARPDVAEDHAERAQNQRGDAELCLRSDSLAHAGS